MENCTLLSLPAEVRLNIYSYLFDDTSIHIDSCTTAEQTPIKSRNRQPALAPLLQTCRFLRHEAEPSYFSRVKVCSDIYQGIPPTNLLNWLHDIGEHNVQLLRKFELRWNNYVNVSLDLKHNTPSAITTDTTQQETKESIVEKIWDLTKTGETLLSSPNIPTPEHMARLSKDNPTTSTHVSEKHTLSIKGAPRITCPELYWKLHGTQEYCSALSTQLSPRLAATLEQRPQLNLTVEEIRHFLADVDTHASSLRWLWYW
jgi:hypothetical protein